MGTIGSVVGGLGKVVATAKSIEAAGLGGKLLPQSLQDVVRPAPMIGVENKPPGREGGAVEADLVTVPPGQTQDTLQSPTTIINTIPYGGEFMQQPQQAGVSMLGSPMVYNRVAQVARQLAGRGGIGGIATGVGVGGLLGGCLLYTSPSPRDGLLSRMPSSA